MHQLPLAGTAEYVALQELGAEVGQADFLARLAAQGFLGRLAAVGMSAHSRVPLAGLDVLPVGTLLQVEFAGGIEHMEVYDRVQPESAAVAFAARGRTHLQPFVVDQRQHFIGRLQQGAVAIAQETKSVVQGVVVDAMPIAPHEGRYQQQQGAARLVEVGDDAAHDVKIVTGGYDDARRSMEHRQGVGVHIIQQRLQCLRRTGLHARLGRQLIGHPLRHMQFVGRQVGAAQHLHAYIIQALERADRSSAHRRAMTAVRQEAFQTAPLHGHPLGVHRVAANFLALHRLECSRAHMEGDFVALDTAFVELPQHFGREMQAGGGSGHRPLDLGVDGLVSLQVLLLGGAVQVGRDGQFADGIEHLGKGDIVGIPRKAHLVPGVAHPEAFRTQCQLAAVHGNGPFQHTLLPLLQIADQARPAASAPLREGELIIGRGVRFQAKDFDEGARSLAKMQTGIDDLGIIEDHQLARRQEGGQIAEDALRHLPAAVHQEFGTVPFGQGIFGDALFGQRILVFRDADMLRCRHSV